MTNEQQHALQDQRRREADAVEMAGFRAGKGVRDAARAAALAAVAGLLIANGAQLVTAAGRERK